MEGRVDGGHASEEGGSARFDELCGMSQRGLQAEELGLLAKVRKALVWGVLSEWPPAR